MEIGKRRQESLVRGQPTGTVVGAAKSVIDQVVGDVQLVGLVEIAVVVALVEVPNDFVCGHGHVSALLDIGHLKW